MIRHPAVVKSWVDLRDELIKMFDQKVPFFKVMQKIEGRKWLPGRETYLRRIRHRQVGAHASSGLGGEGQNPPVDRRHHAALAARYCVVRRCDDGGHLLGAHEADHARRRGTGREADGAELDDQAQGRSLQELREKGSRS